MNLRIIAAHAPLPMLALAASFGVYQYALLYVPWWVALVQAAAFEMTYIGLTVANIQDATQRNRARMVSLGAVMTSIIYNTLAALFHRMPGAFVGLPLAGELAFAALHGLPLAWVAFLVADLLLHAPARSDDAEHPAPIRALSAHACRKCGASVDTQQQSAATARWGCAACRVKKVA